MTYWGSFSRSHSCSCLVGCQSRLGHCWILLVKPCQMMTTLDCSVAGKGNLHLFPWRDSSQCCHPIPEINLCNFHFEDKRWKLGNLGCNSCQLCLLVAWIITNPWIVLLKPGLSPNAIFRIGAALNLLVCKDKICQWLLLN